MISGHVNSRREAVVSLVVRGPHGWEQEIEVVVDTGFSGQLTLPSDLIAELRLPLLGQSRVVLGDGSVILCDVFDGSVLWGGRARQVNVEAADTEPLVGMRMLHDHELAIQVFPGGNVSIRLLLLS